MKGTIKDLRLAEQLAQKGRFLDALKMMDRILGLPTDGTFGDKIGPMRAAILADEPLFGADELAMVTRPDGQAQVSINLGRMKLPADTAAELLTLRARWLVAFVDATRTQPSVELSLGEMSALIEVLKDPDVAARMEPDDQATLLALCCDPFFIINDMESVAGLLQSALFRAPANRAALGILRSLVETLRGNLQKNTPSAVAKRDQVRAGIEALTPLLTLAEAAAEVVGEGPVPDADTVKRRIAERLSGRAPAPAEAPPHPPPAPPEPRTPEAAVPPEGSEIEWSAPPGPPPSVPRARPPAEPAAPSSPPQIAPLPLPKDPPPKRGFWRRLFGGG
jgi:hypothetical protein